MGTICDESRNSTKIRYPTKFTKPTRQNNNTLGYVNYDEAPICKDNTSGNENYILGEIVINKDLVNKDARIINSYEAYERSIGKTTFDENIRNEIEIRKCNIYIEGKLIPFSYFYKFDKKGTFKIKYCFQNNLKSLYALFCQCYYIKTLNFSNFNTNDVTSTEYMLYECSQLTELNLTNFNTNNVTNMQYMFNNCRSLRELNLSSFNTNNVTNMQYMFNYCLSLKELSLSSFNTNNVTNMQNMFYYCSSLTNLDLSNFKTQKKTDLNNMFKYCENLTKSLLICYDKNILDAASYYKYYNF